MVAPVQKLVAVVEQSTTPTKIYTSVLSRVKTDFSDKTFLFPFTGDYWWCGWITSTVWLVSWEVKKDLYSGTEMINRKQTEWEAYSMREWSLGFFLFQY